MMCQPLRRLSNSIADHWLANKFYPANSVVMYDGTRWYNPNDVAKSETFDRTKWIKQSVQEVLKGTGSGDMKHSEFKDIKDIEAGDALKEVKEKMNTIIRLLRGSTLCVSILFALSSFGALTATNVFDDIRGTNTLGSIMTDLGNSPSDITNISEKSARALKPRKIDKYLWEIGTEGENFAKATNRMSIAFPSYGRCSGVSAGKIHGRNLDWEYNREATIIVRAPSCDYPSEHRFSSIGVAGCNKLLTEDFLLSGKWGDVYYSLPFTLTDGMNECGVVVQQNVLQTNYTYSVSWRTNGNGKIICFCIIRYVLDRCSTAEEAARMICDLNFVPAEYAYDFHYLVSDKNESFIVEDGKVYYKDGRVYEKGTVISENPRPTDVMTNFRIGGTVIFDDEGKVDWNSVGGDEEGIGGYDAYGMGLERYDLVREKEYDTTSVDGMVAMMKDLWYTKTYNNSTDPFWFTEYCDMTKNSLNVYNAKHNPGIFYDEVISWREKYNEDHDTDNEFYRSGRSWQTTHTTIYDKENLNIYLLTQEDSSKIRCFNLIENKQGDYALTTNDVTNIVTNIYNENKKNSSYLSVWDCSTGLPITNPTKTNYTYQKGDFYIVGNVATGMYEHTINMSGYTRGIGFVYTNLVFSFTNNESSVYKTFDDVIIATEKIKSGSKTAFSANGKLVNNEKVEYDVKYVDPIIEDIKVLQLVDSSGTALGSDGQATNAIFILDNVSTIGSDNYKPDGGVYTNGTKSSVLETDRVCKNDTYYYDGEKWILVDNNESPKEIVATNVITDLISIGDKAIFKTPQSIVFSNHDTIRDIGYNYYGQNLQEYLNCGSWNIAEDKYVRKSEAEYIGDNSVANKFYGQEFEIAKNNIESIYTTLTNIILQMGGKVKATNVPIMKPTPVSGIVYDGTMKIGVKNIPTVKQSNIEGTTSATNAGSYSATFTLKPGYTWNDSTTNSVTLSWEISMASLSGKTLTLNPTTYVYDGMAKEPTGVIQGLVVGTDFTMSYTNNVNVGMATATATGKGNYTGTVSENFTITEPQYTGLKMTAQQNGSSVTLNKNGLFDGSFETSPSGAEGTWTDYTYGTSIHLTSGQTVYWRVKKQPNERALDNYVQFSMEGSISASGNCMSMVDAAMTEDTVPEYGFDRMFAGCTSLTTAPTLPATELAVRCYASMFLGCISLTTAPDLPATTLADYCYASMFRGCTSLTTAPALPSTNSVFACYQSMFRGCTGLTTAPTLPATTLAYHCYKTFFYGCTNLNSVTASFTKWNESNFATEDWLNNVSPTGTFTCPSALDTSTHDASHIPGGWDVNYK